MKSNVAFTSSHPSARIGTAACLGLVFLLVWAGVAMAQRDDLRVVGGKDSLWVLYEVSGQEGPETRVWTRQVDRGFRRPRMGARQTREIKVAAACGASLHLFYRSGTHYRIEPTQVSPQIVMPGHMVPLYLAGDSFEEVLYAIAAHQEGAARLPATTSAPATPTATTSAASTQPRAVAVSTRAATITSAEIPVGPGRRESAWDLYRFHRGKWVSVSALPAWFQAEDQHWMCAEKGAVHLFGLARAPDATVWYRRFSDRRWSSVETVPVPSNANPVAAMVVNTYLVLVARAATLDGASKVIGVRRPAGKDWEQVEFFTAEGKSIDLAPGRLGAACFKDTVALVGRFVEDGQLQAGFWSTEGGPPKDPPKPLPKWPTQDKPSTVPKLPEAVVLAILAAVIMLTLWRRQDSLMREVSLPRQVALASIWRRLAAFLIDLAPAVVICVAYWLPEYTQVQNQIRNEDFTQAEQADRFLAALWWPWLACRILYAFYCTITEYRLGTSPGKRLMQCWLVSTDLARPGLKQVAIRNVLKILELQPEVVALLVFVVLTRNRQRLGDLLAGTIVVEPATPEED